MNQSSAGERLSDELKTLMGYMRMFRAAIETGDQRLIGKVRQALFAVMRTRRGGVDYVPFVVEPLPETGWTTNKLLPDAVLVIAPDFTITYVNESLGLDGHMAVGQKCYQALYNQPAQCPDCFMRDMPKDPAQVKPIRRRVQGKWLYVFPHLVAAPGECHGKDGWHYCFFQAYVLDCAECLEAAGIGCKQKRR